MHFIYIWLIREATLYLVTEPASIFVYIEGQSYNITSAVNYRQYWGSSIYVHPREYFSIWLFRCFFVVCVYAQVLSAILSSSILLEGAVVHVRERGHKQCFIVVSWFQVGSCFVWVRWVVCVYP